MTAEEFAAWPDAMGMSRRKMCDLIGITRRTADAYALGRSPVPLTVALAIAALNAGLAPAASPK